MDQLLLCDSCGLAYHNYCLVPPLQDIPRRSWRCAECIAKVGVIDYVAYPFDIFRLFLDLEGGSHKATPVVRVLLVVVIRSLWSKNS